jgi:hypothetical protein
MFNPSRSFRPFNDQCRRPKGAAEMKPPRLLVLAASKRALGGFGRPGATGMLTGTLLAAALLASGCATGAPPPPLLADVTVIDRITGETLPVHAHRGERWVAGTPGNRYSIVLHNRGTERVLAVLSVDGVNAISGQTAAWDQTGYVLDPGERAEIRGWRKSQERIAAFEFTALPDSYAARTGRPENVGVIGVALFREAPKPPKVQAAPSTGSRRDQSGAAAAEATGRADSVAPPAPSLGTGHGRSEWSQVQYTRFERARPSPDEVVAIRYDSRSNLIAKGVIQSRHSPAPEPFPGVLGFVPDPPRP